MHPKCSLDTSWKSFGLQGDSTHPKRRTNFLLLFVSFEFIIINTIYLYVFWLLLVDHLLNQTKVWKQRWSIDIISHVNVCFVQIRFAYHPKKKLKTKNPLFIDGNKVFSMKAKEFRKLSPEAIEHLEKSAIKFLAKYGRFHPIEETYVMQNTLQIIWHLLSSRF